MQLLRNKQRVQSKLSADGHSTGLVLKGDSSEPQTLLHSETLLHSGFNQRKIQFSA